MAKKEQSNNKKSVKGLGLGLALSAAAGVIAGFLFAPKSGKETREDIKDGLNDIKDFASETTTNVADFAKKRTDDVKTFVDETTPKVKKAAKKQADEAVKAAKKQLDEAKKFAKNIKKSKEHDSKPMIDKNDEK